MDIAKFKRLPIMGILRGVPVESVEPLLEAIISAGLETVEITMNTSDAAAVIRKMVRCGGRRLAVGAGTVLNMDSLRAAMDAGATFIVMPTLISEVIEYCVKNVIPVFPGALTPEEIYRAWNAGATMVKVFPSGFFGPEYFKEIKGPFNNIELMACGGVRAGNIKQYFSNGASAVAFGGSIFNEDMLKKGGYAGVSRAVQKLVSEVLVLQGRPK